MYYREWASKVGARRGRMVSLNALKILLSQYDPGYASLYAFDKSAADQILSQGHSKGLNKFHVFAESLTIDIDSGIEGLSLAVDVLNTRGLHYEVWQSGGKGFHVIVPHQPIFSVDLPYAHKGCIEELGLERVADMSLYQHGRLISLPGRVHPKTRLKKRLLYIIHGRKFMLDINNIKVPQFRLNIQKELGMLATGLMRAADLITKPPTEGNRHTQVWGTSKALMEAGLSFDTVLEIMTEVNETWEEPKSPEELKRAVHQAYNLTA